MSRAHNRSHRRAPQFGGVVSVTPIRNRLGDEGRLIRLAGIRRAATSAGCRPEFSLRRPRRPRLRS